MADFDLAFEPMIGNEGGYKLTSVPGDRGGQTYAGIARKRHPQWPGWQLIDSGDMQNPQLPRFVQGFYKLKFWDAVSGDAIQRQAIAATIFDFAVNAGPATAIKLAQQAAGVTPDGRIGPVTLAALNTIDEDLFLPRYAIAKLARYAEICNKDRGQTRFLLGWMNRTIKGLA